MFGCEFLWHVDVNKYNNTNMFFIFIFCNNILVLICIIAICIFKTKLRVRYAETDQMGLLIMVHMLNIMKLEK